MKNKKFWSRLLSNPVSLIVSGLKHDPRFGVLSPQAYLQNRCLNLLGIQILRYFLAHVCLWVRRARLKNNLSEYDKTLSNDGIVLIPEFLPTEQFDAIKTQFEKIASANSWDVHFSFNAGESRVSTQPTMASPDLSRVGKFVLNNPTLIQMLKAAEGRKSISYSVSAQSRLVGYFEQVYNGDPDIEVEPFGPEDARGAHTDIFFTSHKAFLYINDVTQENGPFCYVKKSHRFNLRRLFFEYRQSLKSKDKIGELTTREYQWMQNEQSYFVACAPANTLVIANTSGIHKRGFVGVQQGTQRNWFMANYRANPFVL